MSHFSSILWDEVTLLTSKVAQGNFVRWAMLDYGCKTLNILYWVLSELRTTSASAILGGYRMALDCSGLHASGCE